MRVKVFVVIIFFLFITKGSAQNEANSIFQLLDMAPSARSLALGGKTISINDSTDVALFQINPALARPSDKNQIAFNHSFYYAGSSYSTLSSSYYWKKQNLQLIGGIQSLRHGDIIMADEFGNKMGTFTANENKVILGASKKLFDPLYVGLNVNVLFSSIESYTSSGFGFDLGASYQINDWQHAGLVIKNLGAQWDHYQQTQEPLPFDVLLGYTKRLKYVPFQLSITAHQLHTWNLRGPDRDPQTTILGEPIAGPSAFSKQIDNLFRHLIIGGEMFLGKTAPMRLRLSYTHKRHQELKDDFYRGLSGFSGGFGINKSKLSIDYGFANYHLAGSIHAIGIAVKW